MQAFSKLFNLLFVVLFFIVVKSNDVVLGVVLLHLLVLGYVGSDSLDVIHESSLKILTADSDGFATDDSHVAIKHGIFIFGIVLALTRFLGLNGSLRCS